MMGSRIHGNPDCGMSGGIWKTFLTHYSAEKCPHEAVVCIQFSPWSNTQNMNIFTSGNILLSALTCFIFLYLIIGYACTQSKIVTETK